MTLLESHDHRAEATKVAGRPVAFHSVRYTHGVVFGSPLVVVDAFEQVGADALDLVLVVHIKILVGKMIHQARHADVIHLHAEQFGRYKLVDDLVIVLAHALKLNSIVLHDRQQTFEFGGYLFSLQVFDGLEGRTAYVVVHSDLTTSAKQLFVAVDVSEPPVLHFGADPP